MPGVGLDVQASHLCIGDLDALGIAFLIQFATHSQARFGRRGGDQVSSADVTRLRRSYDPVRHPSDPPLRSGVEAATSDPDGSPSITRITIPTCCVQYPGRPDRCVCRLLPCPRGLPRAKGGSASASTLSRPARTSLTLRPVGSLGHPRRPLSRGFDEASCPAAPLVSFRINRQLSGWNLPP